MRSGYERAASSWLSALATTLHNLEAREVPLSATALKRARRATRGATETHGDFKGNVREVAFTVPADRVRRQAGARPGARTGVRPSARTSARPSARTRARTTAGGVVRDWTDARQRGAPGMGRTAGFYKERGLAGNSPAKPSIKTTTSSHRRNMGNEQPRRMPFEKLRPGERYGGERMTSKKHNPPPPSVSRLCWCRAHTSTRPERNHPLASSCHRRLRSCL